MAAAHPHRGDFLLAACQGGAEEALVERQRAALPRLVRAAWRRGVVTFRLPAGAPAPTRPELDRLVFARTVIWSSGQVSGATETLRVERLHALVGVHAWDDVHVWNRVPRVAGDPAAVRAAITAGLDADRRATVDAADGRTPPGGLVLDCVIDGPDRWWVGWHVAETPPGRWPGGEYPATLPAGKVSRAWLKLDEAITVFGVDLRPGERAIELGAAPGGACQRLLEAGLVVTGVDPALVDECVAGHPRFEQWRMRARDVRLRSLSGFDWIVADMNIDPTSTLEAIGRVVSAPGAAPRGIVATLKLPQWSRAAELSGWLERFSEWGYRARAGQLSSGGREICVVADRRAVRRATRRATRRPGR